MSTGDQVRAAAEDLPPVSRGVSDDLTLLTPGQLQHMHVFGYLVLRGLLTAPEAGLLQREAAEIMAAEGVDHPGGRSLQPFFERGPFLSQLPADDRIHGLGEDLLGPDFFLDGTEGNLHAGDTPWHGGDGSTSQVLPEIKIASYPTAMKRATPCPRVMAGHP
ncbi:MAG: hypothetical protein OXH50_16235, partial [Gemmatimonadetes bacterium]|nr:hypothetical protein [Gemmatimonadota bacterium]